SCHLNMQISACFVCFFIQAEDGIRDDLVTGVQTCALPISSLHHEFYMLEESDILRRVAVNGNNVGPLPCFQRADEIFRTEQIGRSEERRVGKGGRAGRWQEDIKENKEIEQAE